MLIAGIDIGSGTTKCVLVNESHKVHGRGQVKTKADFEKVSCLAMEAACADAGVGADAVGYIATTGLGRYAVSFRDIQITDLTCGARGAATLFPDAAFVLDAVEVMAYRIGIRPGAGDVLHFRYSTSGCSCSFG